MPAKKQKAKRSEVFLSLTPPSQKKARRAAQARKRQRNAARRADEAVPPSPVPATAVAHDDPAQEPAGSLGVGQAADEAAHVVQDLGEALGNCSDMRQHRVHMQRGRQSHHQAIAKLRQERDEAAAQQQAAIKSSISCKAS